jgi:hypothetical protein
MHEEEKRAARADASYPTGRGYGNDYMRGGEVFGGYGYSERPEYEQRRGDTGEHGVAAPVTDHELSP